MIGIYSITNKINGKVYIGQTDNYARRYYHHILKLSNDKHPVKLLQKDFNKYGESVFEFKMEEECAIDKLDELEKHYIEKLNAFEDNNGYNANTGGKSGYEVSQRTKNEMSQSKKQKFTNDKDYYNKITNHNREMAQDPEHLHRLQNMASLYFTDDTKQKISEAQKEIWTDEKKNQKSEEMKCRYTNPEEKLKTSEATKAGMAKMTKEQKSRRQLCKVPTDILIECVKNKQLTQIKMTEKYEKYGMTISMAKSIKAGKHWIYDYIKENDIVL